MNNSFEGRGSSNIQIGNSTGPVTSSNIFISSNNFNTGVSGVVAIDAQSYVGIIIANNQFGANTTVTLGSDEGNKYSIVDGNYGLDLIADLTYSGTDGKILFQNSLAGTTTDRSYEIPDGTTQPLVRGIPTLVTANTGATSITRFLGTASGDVFTLAVADSNTTIVNGTNLLTDTGSNLTPSSGDLITFCVTSGLGSGNEPVARVINKL